MNIIIKLIDLPVKCPGYARKNEDDTFTILLNSRLNMEQQRAAFIHELSHIDNNDFDVDMQADLIEGMRHLCVNSI